MPPRDGRGPRESHHGSQGDHRGRHGYDQGDYFEGEREGRWSHHQGSDRQQRASEREPIPPSKSLYVRDLAPSVTEDHVSRESRGWLLARSIP